MKFVPSVVSRNLGRQSLILQKNSPHIAFGIGIVGVVAGTVLACRATLKLEETLDDIQHEVDDLKQHKSIDYNRDMAYVYAKGAYRLGKLYGPAVLVTGTSIAALTSSHVVMTRRNNALTATVVAITKAYEEYRDRVREEFGVEKELQLFTGSEEKVIEGPDGKPITVAVIDPDKLSPFARLFDEYSTCWTKDPELNRAFVRVQQTYANDLLQSRGHIFLNEVYDSLGLPRSQEGAVVGWVLNGDGDNFVDFGLDRPGNELFAAGWERSVLLDFNVDGVIYNKIG